MRKNSVLSISFLLAMLVMLAIGCKKNNGDPPAPSGGSLSNLKANPDSALPNTLIDISGSGLQGLVSVKFDTVNSTINPVYNTDSHLLIYVPGGARYGVQKITLTNGLGGTAQINFKVIQPAPTITAVNPLSANVGDTVTITGTFFRNIVKVLLGAVQATVIDSTSPNVLKFKVPAGVSAGLVTVTTAGGTAVSTATVTTEKALLIADFDGGGLYPDGSSWYSYGDMTSKTVASSDPVALQGNFIKAIPKTTNTAGYAGISTPSGSGSPSFALPNTAANTYIKFDANSNGYTSTQVQVLLEDQSGNNFNRVVSISWNGWQTVALKLSDFYFGYGTDASQVVNPAQIRTLKFHFVNYNGVQGQVNLDNIRFTY
ncbi:MAG: glycan-binding surface protein [Chitinophagaceae bacterium]